jgi:murein DD-endopeptidase MepM/ murein hydrolase activator NlpD
MTRIGALALAATVAGVAALSLTLAPSDGTRAAFLPEDARSMNDAQPESAAVEAIAGAELGSACPNGSVTSGPASAFEWPLSGLPIIARPFDAPAQPWLAGHRGVDLQSEAGQAVLAPAAGTVRFNGWVVDRHLIVIEHGELASTLEPVTSELAVGQNVSAGQAVGVLADEAAHCADCLHWGVRRGEVYLDPTLLVCPLPRAVLWE